MVNDIHYHFCLNSSEDLFLFHYHYHQLIDIVRYYMLIMIFYTNIYMDNRIFFIFYNNIPGFLFAHQFLLIIFVSLNLTLDVRIFLSSQTSSLTYFCLVLFQLMIRVKNIWKAISVFRFYLNIMRIILY